MTSDFDAKFYRDFFRDFQFVMDALRPELSATEFQIYLTLINKSWIRNLDYLQISIKELSAESGLAIMTAKTCLRNLAHKKLIKVTAKATNKVSTSYKIFRPQELVYYQPVLEKFSRDENLSTESVATISPDTGMGGPLFISERLDTEDQGALLSILGGLRPEDLNQYRLKAEERIKESHLEMTEKNITGQRNDFIIFENFGPIRVEKYL